MNISFLSKLAQAAQVGGGYIATDGILNIPSDALFEPMTNTEGMTPSQRFALACIRLVGGIAITFLGRILESRIQRRRARRKARKATNNKLSNTKQ